MITKLFIYGNLQDPNIQMQLLGRVCQGKYALLDNHILLRDWPVNGTAYPRLYPHSVGCVVGQIIEVTEIELALLDEYETTAYRRDTIPVKGEGLIETYVANKRTN